ncbi:hypothetical protein CPJCM30710_28010 [Clostridium polyendosporum]|uniref:Uncharacterized protein n=1 Tax=Clostridium polyendosporum TaxID=69208 RepID=A0A919VH84_9CLOT|nr:hypothetical protein [Clostridium polyendosporum]GIM30135.1 hypothetical protein CPJCM30710_28010 [Clostridium polyendosporum]
MKKQLKYSLPISIFLFIATVLIAIGAGYYKNSLSTEKPSFKINLPAEKTNSKVVYNFSNQGLPKKLVQPKKISIATGHGGGITNVGKEPLSIKVETEDFIGTVKLSSTTPGFDPSTGIFTKPLLPRKSVTLDVELDIPSEKIKHSEIINNAAIKFINTKDGSLLGTVPVQVINSTTVAVNDMKH